MLPFRISSRFKAFFTPKTFRHNNFYTNFLYFSGSAPGHWKARARKAYQEKLKSSNNNPTKTDDGLTAQQRKERDKEATRLKQLEREKQLKEQGIDPHQKDKTYKKKKKGGKT